MEIALRPGTDTFQGAVEIEIATRAPLDVDIRETVFPLLMRPAFDPDTATIPFEFLRQNYDRLLPLLPRDVFGDYAVYVIRTGEGYLIRPGGRQ